MNTTNPTNAMNTRTIFYDGHCGLCCSFHEWLNRQPQRIALRFLPYQSPAAGAEFPELTALHPDREMVVRDDATGKVYQGAEAWVACLDALEGYHAWARRLATPALLPFAKKTCLHIANNRRRLSKVFFRKKDADVAAELHRMPPRPAACIGGVCEV